MSVRGRAAMLVGAGSAARLARLARVAAVAAAVAFAGGCEVAGPLFKGDRDVPPERPGEAAAGADGADAAGAALAAVGTAGDWPFLPADIRVHPFTSIATRPGGGQVLEARIELLDQLADPTKGVGRFRFELYARPIGAAGAGRGERLTAWNAPLTTLGHNARHYDPITRTYSFRLHLDATPPVDRRLTLHVQFTDHAGRRFTADAPVGQPAG